jgi:hypothetical protein
MWFGVPVGPFEERAGDWRAETFQPWGQVTADLDNDGRVDVFIPSGMGNPFDFWPNALLHNEGTSFSQVQAEVGLDPPPGGAYDKSVRLANGQAYVSAARTALAADFDEDGDLDLVVMNWDHPLHLLRNDLPPGRHWLDVELVGRAPRDPFGAWVEVRAGGRTQSRWLHGAHGYLSQGPRRVHFGLGEAASVQEVKVFWPDGSTSTVKDPPADGRLTIEQE